MAKVELRADEHTVYEGHPSWRALTAFYIVGLVVAVVVFLIIGFR